MTYTAQDIDNIRATIPEEYQASPENAGLTSAEFTNLSGAEGIADGEPPANEDYADTPDTDAGYDNTDDNDGQSKRDRHNQTQQTQSMANNVYMIGGVAYTQAEVQDYANDALNNFDEWYEENKEHFESREDARNQLNKSSETGVPTEEVAEAMADDRGQTKQQAQENDSHRPENQRSNISQQQSRPHADELDKNPVRDKAPEVNNQFTMASEGQNIGNHAQTGNEATKAPSLDDSDKPAQPPTQDFSMGGMA